MLRYGVLRNTETYGSALPLNIAHLSLSGLWWFLGFSPIALWVTLLIQITFIGKVQDRSDSLGVCSLASLTAGGISLAVGVAAVWLLNTAFGTHIQPIYVIYPIQALMGLVSHVKNYSL